MESKNSFYKNLRNDNRNMNRNDRPIKSSKNGKYNMNFIDWNNEWERVSEVEIKIQKGEDIEDKEEESRVKNNMNYFLEKLGVNIDNFLLIKTPDCKKECYICLKYFMRNKRIRQLPCKHMFCEDCLRPWLKTNYTCPVCKFKLKNDDEDENVY